MLYERMPLKGVLFVLFSIVAILSYVFPYFYVGSYSMALLLSLLSFILVLLLDPRGVFRDIPSLYLWMALSIAVLLSYFYWTDLVAEIEVFKSIFLTVIYSLILIVASNLEMDEFPVKIVENLLRVFLLVNSLLTVLQFVMVITNGSYIRLFWQNSSIKPSGFLGESAQLGFFYFLFLSVARIKTSNIERIIHLLALMLTASLLSFFTLVVILTRDLFRLRESGMKPFIIILLIVVLTLISVTMAIPNMRVFIYNSYVSRIWNMFFGIENELSGFTRVYSAFFIYSEIETKDKLLGSGPGEVSQVFEGISNSPYYHLLHREQNYSALFYELINFGIPIFILINVIYFRTLTRKHHILDFILLEAFRLGGGFNINHYGIVIVSLALMLPDTFGVKGDHCAPQYNEND